MIRVIIADDHTLVRQGLVQLLRLLKDVTSVAEAEDGQSAIRVCATAAYDVLLLDWQMPRGNGDDVLRALGDDKKPTLVLTTFDDDAQIAAARAAGAKGFLLKDCSLETLGEAISALARGETYFRSSIPASMETKFEAAPVPDALTQREREILRLLAGGCSNKEIAQTLGSKEGTVKNQVSAILSKLGVRDRTRAVLRAIQLGFI